MLTWPVKDGRDILINQISKIVNKLTYMGVFPRSMKASLVKLLITKTSLGCNILNNYRAASNLIVLSKIIEGADYFNLNKWLFNEHLNESLHYAHKSGHTTETALVQMKNYIMTSTDQCQHFKEDF